MADREAKLYWKNELIFAFIESILETKFGNSE